MVNLMSVTKENINEIINPLEGYLFLISDKGWNKNFYVFGPKTLLKCFSNNAFIFPQRNSKSIGWNFCPKKGIEENNFGFSGERLLLKGKKGIAYEVTQIEEGIFGIEIPLAFSLILSIKLGSLYLSK